MDQEATGTGAVEFYTARTVGRTQELGNFRRRAADNIVSLDQHEALRLGQEP